MRILSEVDVVVQLQDGDVVGEGAGVEFRVHVDADDVALYVRIELDVVIDVPFAEPRAQIATGVRLDAMRGGDDVTRRHQSAAANVNALVGVLLQDCHLPRVFACEREGNISYRVKMIPDVI